MTVVNDATSTSYEEMFKLETPQNGKDYDFPFNAYNIQVDLMKHLFEAYENKKLAIVESPTGTGKSLSIICSSMTWLNQHSKRAASVQVDLIRDQLKKELVDEPDWVIEHEINRKLDQITQRELDIQEKIEKIRNREAEKSVSSKLKRRKIEKNQEDVADEEFAPDNNQDPSTTNEDGFSDKVKELTKKLYAQSDNNWKNAEDEPDVDKIIFASRTHSQLSQFVAELKKTNYGTTTRFIPIGSRQNLCINDKVIKAARGHVDALNERCLDLQQNSKDNNRCEFLPKSDEYAKLDSFRDFALATPRDIEDIEDLGRTRKVCPYYGARHAVRQAQVVTMPYNLLLQKDARESLGINLKDNVVIFDEAHNLIDTILSVNSVTISTQSLKSTRQGIKIYLDKFRNRLKGKNAVILKQLYGVISALEGFGKKWAHNNKDNKQTQEIMMPAHVVKSLASGADQVNFHELNTLLRESKLIHKISGYADKVQSQQNAQTSGQKGSTTGALHSIQTFLLALTNPDKNGRILVQKLSTENKDDEISLKYLLLNPAEHFRNVVDESRALVLAGGTMSPMEDFMDQLFDYCQNRVTTLSCNHVVDPKNVLVRSIGVGPRGNKLELTHANRSDFKVLDDLGQLVNNIVSVTNGGLVCFVSSYGWLDLLIERWKAKEIFQRFSKRKKVFLEPKSAGDVDKVLKEYSLACCEGSGAILFSVVGGKLSEGINFANDLCRSVIMLGIPYANAADLELQERMKIAGRSLYGRLASRAVNQSIGRAIRHEKDWAAIILVDVRYCMPANEIRTNLPQWVKTGLLESVDVGSLMRDLGAFRRSKGT